MSNKDTYKRKHKYLDNQINSLEKHNHYNRTLISSLKKKKLRLKDKMISDSREDAQAKQVQSTRVYETCIVHDGLTIHEYMIY